MSPLVLLLPPGSRSVSQLLSSPVVCWCCWCWSDASCSWAARRRICSERRLEYWLPARVDARLLRDARPFAIAEAAASSFIRKSASECCDARKSVQKFALDWCSGH